MEGHERTESDTREGRSRHGSTGRGVAIGAGIGIVFGAAFDAPGPGMVLGAALGLAGAFLSKLRDPPRR